MARIVPEVKSTRLVNVRVLQYLPWKNKKLFHFFFDRSGVHKGGTTWMAVTTTKTTLTTTRMPNKTKKCRENLQKRSQTIQTVRKQIGRNWSENGSNTRTENNVFFFRGAPATFSNRPHQGVGGGNLLFGFNHCVQRPCAAKASIPKWRSTQKLPGN